MPQKLKSKRLRKDYNNYIGTKHTMLTIVSLLYGQLQNDGSTRVVANCLCECGVSKSILLKEILSGKVKSCSCRKKMGLTKTHGLHNSPTYKSYYRMKNRCTNKNDKSYSYYGGRGIVICDRWLNSFVNFYSDMGEKPSVNHTIDRINNNGNYEPSNCRWATMAEQNSNKRISSAYYQVEYEGEKYTLYDLAKKLNVRYNCFLSRISLRGGNISEAINFKHKIKNKKLS